MSFLSSEIDAADAVFSVGKRIANALGEGAIATRSTKIHLHNRTSKVLELAKTDLYHGEWSNDKKPAKVIKPGHCAIWIGASCGFMTGTSGCVWYDVAEAELDYGDQVKVYWSNPYSGSNDWNFEQPSGFEVTKNSGGKGDNAVMQWSVRELPETEKDDDDEETKPFGADSDTD